MFLFNFFSEIHPVYFIGSKIPVFVLGLALIISLVILIFLFFSPFEKKNLLLNNKKNRKEKILGKKNCGMLIFIAVIVLGLFLSLLIKY